MLASYIASKHWSKSLEGALNEMVDSRYQLEEWEVVLASVILDRGYKPHIVRHNGLWVVRVCKTGAILQSSSCPYIGPLVQQVIKVQKTVNILAIRYNLVKALEAKRRVHKARMLAKEHKVYSIDKLLERPLFLYKVRSRQCTT